jgi:hypothetical protein
MEVARVGVPSANVAYRRGSFALGVVADRTVIITQANLDAHVTFIQALTPPGQVPPLRDTIERRLVQGI